MRPQGTRSLVAPSVSKSFKSLQVVSATAPVSAFSPELNEIQVESSRTQVLALEPSGGC